MTRLDLDLFMSKYRIYFLTFLGCLTILALLVSICIHSSIVLLRYHYGTNWLIKTLVQFQAGNSTAEQGLVYDDYLDEDSEAIGDQVVSNHELDPEQLEQLLKKLNLILGQED